jgi:hypothetical protein
MATNATAFIPELWDAAVYRTLEDNLVLDKICTQKGEQKGNKTYFGTMDDPTIFTSYTPGTINWEFASTGQIELDINQVAGYAIKTKSIEQAMATLDIKGSQASRAGYQLKRAIEMNIFQNILTDAAGGTVTDTTLDSGTILGVLAQAATLLEVQNVMSKILVVSPAVKQALVNAGVKFQINNGVNGKGGMFWANELDFMIYVTNTVYQTGGVHNCFACSENSIVWDKRLDKTETVNQIGDDPFLKGIAGLTNYGFKVVKPLELVKLALTPIAETAM